MTMVGTVLSLRCIFQHHLGSYHYLYRLMIRSHILTKWSYFIEETAILLRIRVNCRITVTYENAG